MVLQAYGSAVPSAPKPRAGRTGTMKAAAVAGISLMALALLVSSHSFVSQPEELVQEDLDQHLMSQNSRYSTEMKADDKIFETEGHANTHASLSAWTGKDSATFDQLKDISSRPVSDAESDIKDSIKTSEGGGHKNSWFKNWGSVENYFKHSARTHKANKWEDQLQKLKEKEAARRKKEDESYFAGVEKAFGKKAGLAMMDAFDGKSSGNDNTIDKLKLDDRKLAARKAALAHNSQLPASKSDRDKIAEVMHKAIALKKVHVHAASDAKASDAAQAGVKEALSVAKRMQAHKDPVAKTAPHRAAPDPEAKDTTKAAPEHKKFDIHHPGVVADSQKIKKLVHEFHHAHGKEKKVLKARVMQLQQDIVDAFKQVTNYGHRAETAFARAEAREKKA